MVLVPKKDKLAIYTYFLQEGVFASKKDYARKNENIDVPNINCFLVMRSWVSRKFATEIFKWQWHYYCLTSEGVEYLREYLGLPKTVIPNTHKFETQNLDEQENNEDNNGEERRGNRRGGRGTRGTRGSRGRGRGRGKDGEGESQPQEATVEA